MTLKGWNGSSISSSATPQAPWNKTYSRGCTVINRIDPKAVMELRSLRERIKAIDPTCDVFLVGGYLRDLLIYGRADGDFDYVTNLHPDKAVQLGFNRVGDAFPVFLTDQNSELALTRTERKTGLGYNGFSTEFTPSFREDALRRDLTINTLLWNPEMGLVMPVEQAAFDFQNQVLRACTEAFAEDPLRVVRLARFAQRFEWDIDWETSDMCDAVADEVCHLDSNRLRDEIDKILKMDKGLDIFYHALPQTVADHWLGHEFNTRSFNGGRKFPPGQFKGVSFKRFSKVKDRPTELRWAWFAMGAKSPTALLNRFGKGDGTHAVLRILQMIDKTKRVVTSEYTLALWTAMRRGLIPYPTWRAFLTTLGYYKISEFLDVFDALPTRPFQDAMERTNYYLAAGKAKFNR
jgi:hypothetical protein